MSRTQVLPQWGVTKVAPQEKSTICHCRDGLPSVQQAGGGNAKVAKEREDLEGVLFRMGRSVRKSDNGKVIATEFDEDELYNLTKDNIEVR